MQDNPYILGFTAGELSPWLSTRFDLAQYNKGAARIENFLVEPYGGLTRRSGSRYIADVYDASGTSRFFPFTYSEDDYLLLELYLGGMRFWQNEDWLRDSSGEIYTLETPWTTEKILQSLRFIQVNDVIFVTSPYIHPSQIRRVDEAVWVYERCEFAPMPKGSNLVTHSDIYVERLSGNNNEFVVDFPDDYPLNIYENHMTELEYLIMTGIAESTDYFLNETLTLYPEVVTDLAFEFELPAGKQIAVKQADTDDYLFYTVIRDWKSIEVTQASYMHPSMYPAYFSPGCAWRLPNQMPYYVPGGWSLQTSGTWDSNWELRRTYDTADGKYGMDHKRWDWHRVHQFSQSAYSDRQNWAFSGYEKVPSHMMLFCLSAKTFSIKSPFYFRIERAEYDIKFRVIGRYNYSQKKLRVVLEDSMAQVPYNFYPTDVRFSAFGVVNGYPSFAGMHEGRLWLGGTPTQPTTLRASALDDFYNFRLGSDANDALELTLASSQQSRMCWMSTERGLLLGTTDAEWLLASSDSGGISATSASFRKESTVGSENKAAQGVENSVFYVQRGGKRLREISYKLESDGYTSTDTSLLAEHLFSSGIKEWAVQRGSSTRVWVLMTDGTLAVLTTNGSQQVNAWQRVSFKDGEVQHIACLVSNSNHDDDVWLIVKRGEKVCIECIQGDGIYLDAHITCTVTEGSIEAAHLASREVVRYPIGDVDAAELVTLDENGRALISDSADAAQYVLGLPMTSLVETFPVERSSNYNTVSQQARVKLRLLDSEARFRYKSTHVERWEDYNPERDHLGFPYTGAVRLTQIPESGVGQGFSIATESMRPFNLLSLSIENDFHGR